MPTALARLSLCRDWMEANWQRLQAVSADLGWDYWQRDPDHRHVSPGVKTNRTSAQVV